MINRVAGWLQQTWVPVALVSGVALLPRLLLAAAAHHPGLWDPTHYYLLGRNIYQGRGLVIDYIWHFANNPPAVTHPIDHWMPLTGVLVAGGLAAGGESVPAALGPFALLGAAQAGLAAWFARRAGLSVPGQVLVGLGTAFIPWLFLSSLHTDTTTPFGVFVLVALAAMGLGLAENGRWLWVSGAFAGLTVLTRNDGLLLLPTLLASAVLFAWRGRGGARWWHYAGFLLMMGLLLAPWVARNQATLGTPWPGSVARAAFVRDHEEFYTYGTEITLARYLAWGLPHIVAKWIFELTASLKLMVVLAGEFFSVAIGLALLTGLRGWMTGRPGEGNQPSRADSLVHALFWPVMPALLFLAGAWLFYGVVTPFLSQAGSFKKAYLGVLPFLLVLGAGAVEHYVRSRRALWIVTLLAVLAIIPHTYDEVRADFALNDGYAQALAPVGQALDELQAGMEGELILMTRDPWSIQYLFGYRAVMVPQDDLDVILDVADRYGVTHILLPVPRQALSGIYEGSAVHPRLSLAATIDGSPERIYAITP